MAYKWKEKRIFLKVCKNYSVHKIKSLHNNTKTINEYCIFVNKIIYNSHSVKYSLKENRDFTRFTSNEK